MFILQETHKQKHQTPACVIFKYQAAVKIIIY
jgi:hypothetical protein